MGQGRFRTEEELVKDSVDLRPSGIRPVVTRHSASRERRGWGSGGSESGRAEAATGRGEAGRSWAAERGGFVCRSALPGWGL